jgi:hypothetical protein
MRRGAIVFLKRGGFNHDELLQWTYSYFTTKRGARIITFLTEGR